MVQKLGAFENLFEDQKKLNNEQKRMYDEQARIIGDLRTELKNIKEQTKGIVTHIYIWHLLNFGDIESTRI